MTSVYDATLLAWLTTSLCSFPFKVCVISFGYNIHVILCLTSSCDTMSMVYYINQPLQCMKSDLFYSECRNRYVSMIKRIDVWYSMAQLCNTMLRSNLTLVKSQPSLLNGINVYSQLTYTQEHSLTLVLAHSYHKTCFPYSNS